MELSLDSSHDCSGRWSDAEHAAFEEGLKKYGRNWKTIHAELVPTRNVLQIRTHAQKYFQRVVREQGVAAAEALFGGNYGTSREKYMDSITGKPDLPVTTKRGYELFFKKKEAKLAEESVQSSEPVKLMHKQKRQRGRPRKHFPNPPEDEGTSASMNTTPSTTLVVEPTAVPSPLHRPVSTSSTSKKRESNENSNRTADVKKRRRSLTAERDKKAIKVSKSPSLNSLNQPAPLTSLHHAQGNTFSTSLWNKQLTFSTTNNNLLPPLNAGSGEYLSSWNTFLPSNHARNASINQSKGNPLWDYEKSLLDDVQVPETRIQIENIPVFQSRPASASNLYDPSVEFDDLNDNFLPSSDFFEGSLSNSPHIPDAIDEDDGFADSRPSFHASFTKSRSSSSIGLPENEDISAIFPNSTFLGQNRSRVVSVDYPSTELVRQASTDDGSSTVSSDKKFPPSSEIFFGVQPSSSSNQRSGFDLVSKENQQSTNNSVRNINKSSHPNTSSLREDNSHPMIKSSIVGAPVNSPMAAQIIASLSSSLPVATLPPLKQRNLLQTAPKETPRTIEAASIIVEKMIGHGGFGVLRSSNQNLPAPDVPFNEFELNPK
jgi:SHAQKYF class myb-like DNA-binding protein